MREKLEELCIEQVESVFKELIDERVSRLRSMGRTLVEGIGLNLDRQVAELEASLQAGLDSPGRDPERIKRLQTASGAIAKLLNQRPA